jgi:hypothetical protein
MTEDKMISADTFVQQEKCLTTEFYGFRRNTILPTEYGSLIILSLPLTTRYDFLANNHRH